MNRPRYRQRCPRCSQKRPLVSTDHGHSMCVTCRARKALGKAFVPHKRQRAAEARSTRPVRKAEDSLSQTRKSAHHGSNPL